MLQTMPKSPRKGKYFDTWTGHVVKVKKIDGKYKIVYKHKNEIVDCNQVKWEWLMPFWYRKIYLTKKILSDTLTQKNEIKYLNTRLSRLKKDLECSTTLLNHLKSKMNKEQLEHFLKETNSVRH